MSESHYQIKTQLKVLTVCTRTRQTGKEDRGESTQAHTQRDKNKERNRKIY